ncbi:MAG: hypothetical protein QNJ13_00085 [Paracoccaceae bacterium]|nr:hypothetical protein [Paracoccaceae bacterium]
MDGITEDTNEDRWLIDHRRARCVMRANGVATPTWPALDRAEVRRAGPN